MMFLVDCIRRLMVSFRCSDVETQWIVASLDRTARPQGNILDERDSRSKLPRPPEASVGDRFTRSLFCARKTYRRLAPNQLRTPSGSDYFD